jgi:hypothetical protein
MVIVTPGNGLFCLSRTRPRMTGARLSSMVPGWHTRSGSGYCRYRETGVESKTLCATVGSSIGATVAGFGGRPLSGPMEMVKLTAVPSLTTLPAVTLWLMTLAVGFIAMLEIQIAEVEFGLLNRGNGVGTVLVEQIRHRGLRHIADIDR